ncbi:MAG: aspartyl protease family protein [Flavisolibacter sp.]
MGCVISVNAHSHLPGGLVNTKFVSIQINSIAEDSVSSVIPFSKAGNLIILQASADSIEGNFILDTGAPHLILNLTYFRHYKSTEHHDAEQSSITGTGSAIVKTMITDFRIGRLNYSRIEADLVNLGNIENTRGVKILGLLGLELFKNCELIIDFDKSLIYLHRLSRKLASKYKNPQLNDTSLYSVVPIEIMDNKIITRTELSGKKLVFVIDSGAESNLLDSRLPNKIFEQVQVTGRVMLSGAGSKKVEALSGDMKQLKIGNKLISNLPVVITNFEKTCISYSGCMDGMLGLDILSIHKIGFNFITRKMYLWK